VLAQTSPEMPEGVLSAERLAEKHTEDEMNGQWSLFEGSQPLKIDKPIRLIELFAGYGSQALSLKYLGVPFEHWRISEWAVKSIQAYRDMHFGDVEDKENTLPDNEILDFLDGKISSDYNTPMKREQIKRTNYRRIFNNMVVSHNVGSIVTAKGKDFDITDTDRFTYLLTYSFPCQDLSNVGLRKGMADTSTRSGMLWEVERLLKEVDELPQILLMENVPAVCGSANIADFAKWCTFLESLGYTNKYKILNATDYGVPQNRERCFMVSWLGDYYYDFPLPIPLTKRLKDVLEPVVDERYYLSEETIKSLQLHKERNEQNGNGFGWHPTDGGGLLTASRQKAATAQTVILSSQGKKLDKYTDVASSLM